MPGLLDKAVNRIAGRGVSKDKAYAMAVASLQKAGDLQAGTLKPTAKGIARNKMSRAQREKNPP